MEVPNTEKRPVRPQVSDDTIYALSSGRVPAAIAVVRISGAKARIGLETIAGTIPEPRRAKRATFREPVSGDVIDDGLVLWFPGPGSETGEDVAELHLHGGRAILSAVFQVLGNIDGFRPAQAGEFTRRALANNKFDVTAVEGLGDLIAAETAGQRRQAMVQYRGGLSRKVDAWRTRLIEAMALVEAAIDFSDEGDVPQNLSAPAAEVARELAEEIKGALDDARRGERLRDGFVVAIAGAPNVGKSTLLNRLAEREVAIVSAVPGTTRDAIEVALDLGGVPVVLVDTAGVRHTTDSVEAEGVRRALARAEAADLVLWLVDCSKPQPSRASAGRAVEVWTKTDLLDSEAQQVLPEQGSIRISAKTGAGIDQLIGMLGREASTLAGEPALVTHERQRHALREAVERIEGALQIASAGQEELFAEELRLAARALGRVTGAVDVEDVLDAVFRNFCIGK